MLQDSQHGSRKLLILLRML